MKTFVLLYLFVKLDEIRTAMGFNLPAIIGVFSAIVFSILVSLCLLISDKKLKKEDMSSFITKYKIKKHVVIFFSFIFMSNTISIFLPSTGQMAAIYLGGTAVNSEAFNTLKNLPDKYSKLLAAKAEEWANEQLNKINQTMEK